MNAQEAFLKARNQLLELDRSGQQAPSTFEWPSFTEFNWVQDYFEPLAAGNEAIALREIDNNGLNRPYSFATMANRARQVANFLQHQGVKPGDRILLSLGNEVALWEIMLGAIRYGAVVIPASTLLQEADLQDRVDRGHVRCIITDTATARRFPLLSDVAIRIAVGGGIEGWADFAESHKQPTIVQSPHRSKGDDLLFLYFTSGTTAKAKLVAHTHVSYPVGHLTTMYWVGLQPGDVHLNLSSPGWAKHAWSSFFAPWNAGAEILAYQYDRFNAGELLETLVSHNVTTFCAPPTVWRLLLQSDLEKWPVKLREAVSAGEPLNAEIIERVQEAWGLNIRDGFGQSEMTAIIANPPSMPIKIGSMGKPLPGCPVVLLNADGEPADEGEICLDLSQPTPMLMQGYMDDAVKTAAAMTAGFYHTGDIASRDADGYLTYVGRGDDVFKSSDYRISPFELESILIEHPAIVEAAVIPSPDPMRLYVPKTFILLAADNTPDRETALSIFRHVRERTSPFKRVRRLVFAELPKTASGKIRRAELRASELKRDLAVRDALEFWEEDFPELRG